MTPSISLKTLPGEAVILENETARLEPLRLEHISALKDVAFDKTNWEYSPGGITDSVRLAQYVARALRDKLSGLAYPFVIYDKRSGEIAGSTRYGNISAHDNRLEIGWTWMATKFRGSGLNKACKFELLRFAFETMKVNRVEFKTDLNNARSRRAIEKIGAGQEGILRQHMKLDNGKWRDTVYYSILNQEWSKIKEEIFSEFL